MSPLLDSPLTESRHYRVPSAGLAALTVSAAALAQSYYDDQACRQFADAQVAPLRDQANSGSATPSLPPASVRRSVPQLAAVGGAAGIGAASGTIVGTGVGAANAQNAEGYLQQQYNAYLCAVHGLSEVSDPAIRRTRAGLWTGPRLRPPAELSATGFVPASLSFPPDRCSILIHQIGRRHGCFNRCADTRVCELSALSLGPVSAPDEPDPPGREVPA